MTREEYVAALQDILSREPSRVRDANRRLYRAVIHSTAAPTPEKAQEQQEQREADLVLAEVAG